jgi:hypothetical protein
MFPDVYNAAYPAVKAKTTLAKLFSKRKESLMA